MAAYYLYLKNEVKAVLNREMKKKILIFQFSYLPGYKAGGSLRTLANLVDHLGDQFDLKVVCRDRDSGDNESLHGIKPDQWQTYGKAEVIYLSPQNISRKTFQNIIRTTKPDLIYLNSFFHRVFSRQPLLLRRLRLIPDIPFIIAPRGEFSQGAIKLKGLKKQIYVLLAKLFGLVSRITWHASNEQEAENIRGLFGQQTQIKVAPDLPNKFSELDKPKRVRNKEKNSLKIIFLSRISRKKNLSVALDMLRNLKGKVQFNIYGPIGDKGYWKECQKIIGLLPSNIKVQYCGEIEYKEVIKTMQEHDLFFMPTLGENFGYVYLEALIAGCPILLSDQTPWRNLEEKGVGWDIPLSQRDRFQEVLKRCINMNTDEYQLWSKRANKFGLEFMQDKEALEKNRNVFYRVLEGK